MGGFTRESEMLASALFARAGVNRMFANVRETRADGRQYPTNAQRNSFCIPNIVFERLSESTRTLVVNQQLNIKGSFCGVTDAFHRSVEHNCRGKLEDEKCNAIAPHSRRDVAGMRVWCGGSRIASSHQRSPNRVGLFGTSQRARGEKCRLHSLA